MPECIRAPGMRIVCFAAPCETASPTLSESHPCRLRFTRAGGFSYPRTADNLRMAGRILPA
jgi:hypothetical protein